MKFFKRLLSPKYSYTFFGTLLPWCIALAIGFISYGLVEGLLIAPPDYQQGDGFRIMYVHVPAAFLSLLIYGVMTVAAFINLVWRIKLADFAVQSAAPIGVAFTLIALVTGAFWGKPMWGAWWVWDARLTAELILFFIYLAIVALDYSLQGVPAACLMRNIFVLIGAVNVPIIHYSVYWWNSLHQGASLSLTGPSHIAPMMLKPLLAMIAGFFALFGVMWLMRMQNLIMSSRGQSRRMTGKDYDSCTPSG